MYQIADLFFFVFHTFLVLFNTFGWWFRKLRPYNLATLIATAFSWFILGIWYGWGYCFCTDWHWSIRRELGYADNTNSYINLLIKNITGLDYSDHVVNTVTVIVFIISLLISIVLNLGDYLQRRRNN